MFSITATNLHWLEGANEAEDLCLHGHAMVMIGDERFEYDATVSSTALYLLKSLTEDHTISEGNQMLPCCGFCMMANDTNSNVDILGCPNGIDWSVFHEGESVVLITEAGNKTNVPLNEYRQTVFEFVDEIEAFYKNSTEKTLPTDELDRNGYLAFWNEWKARRQA